MKRNMIYVISQYQSDNGIDTYDMFDLSKYSNYKSFRQALRKFYCNDANSDEDDENIVYLVETMKANIGEEFLTEELFNQLINE